MMFTEAIVVVDDDCHVQNPGEVMWRVGTHVGPKRDTWTVDGPTDVLEFAVSQPAYGPLPALRLLAFAPYGTR